jgi:ferric-dicitrate binding protein FerR (iron transport regulator)
MNPIPAWQEELQTLCEAVIEDRLTPEQLQRLEQLILADPAARRFYVEYLHQHGSLHWSASEPAAQTLPMGPRPEADVPRKASKPRLWWTVAASALAASIAAAVVTGLESRKSVAAPAAPIATLVSGKGCKWDAGTLPTEEGARLGTGRLRLAEGIARITFDSGVALTLEAPADLEIVSSDQCVLHGGRLVARVPQPAIGFVVDTPTAVVRDLGTEFGVSVKTDQTADVQVFDGLVDVKHRSSGKVEHMKTGENRRYDAVKSESFDPQAEKPATEPAKPVAAGARLVQLSTAMGKGKDAYVQPKYPSEHHSDILLLVKNDRNDKTGDYNRKAYLGIDLTPVKGMKILDAQLSVTFAPTGMGFASEVPDCTFIVYGLTDESLDGWNDKTMRWANAPANRPGGVNLDPTKVVRLGSFQLAQGVQHGARSISGEALVDFLQRDTNGIATFIIVRETLGTGRYCLVHGFAGKNHPTLPPATLKLTVAKP